MEVTKMQKRNLFVISTAIVFVAIGVWAQNNSKQMSEEEARSFVKQVTGVSMPSGKREVSGDRVQYHYILPNRDEYIVDPNRKSIRAIFPSRNPTYRTTYETKAHSLPIKALEKRALTLLTKPKKGEPNWVLLDPPRFSGGTYDFYYEQVLPENGAVSPNWIIVNVNADNGLISSYTIQHNPIPANARLQPKISAEQALKIAGKSVNCLSPQIDKPTKLVYLENGLRYYLNFHGTTTDGKQRWWGGYIDPFTGRVIDIGAYPVLPQEEKSNAKPTKR